MNKYEFAKYDEYKVTDSYWFDVAPLHWTSGRVKDFVETNAITKVPTNITDDDLIEFIPMTNVNDQLGKIKQFNFVPFKEVASGYTKFRNGDVIFAKITPCMENGNCAIVNGLSNNIGFGSTEFMVFRSSRKLTTQYLHYFLHNELYRRNAEPFMRGTAGQKRITSQYMATHYFALPPLYEQKAIADYLDTKTGQIDRKIDLLNQKATKYGKLKQSLINETVTRGLDKIVAMKDSGVEWIGKVPEHWKVNRFKDIFGERSQKGFPDEPILIASQDKGVTLKSSYARNTMTVQKDFHLMKLVKENDFVISLRSFEGGIEIASHRGIISAAYTILFSLDEMCTGYYKHLFKSNKFISMLVTCTTGIREGRNVNYQQLKREIIPIPSVEECQVISDYLDAKTEHIDRIIETINTQIEKLKELRKTLINDVVTGKIKVYQEGEAV